MGTCALLYIGSGAYPIAVVQHPSLPGVTDVWYAESYSLQNSAYLEKNSNAESVFFLEKQLRKERESIRITDRMHGNSFPFTI